MSLSMSFSTNQLKLVSFRQANYAIHNHVQCDKTPLITIGKFVIDLSQVTSFQVKDWSNKLETYSLMPELPLLFTTDALPIMNRKINQFLFQA